MTLTREKHCFFLNKKLSLLDLHEEQFRTDRAIKYELSLFSLGFLSL